MIRNAQPAAPPAVSPNLVVAREVVRAFRVRSGVKTGGFTHGTLGGGGVSRTGTSEP